MEESDIHLSLIQLGHFFRAHSSAAPPRAIPSTTASASAQILKVALFVTGYLLLQQHWVQVRSEREVQLLVGPQMGPTLYPARSRLRNPSKQGNRRIPRSETFQ